MTTSIRLLPFASADGATNMAADEALLDSASERGIASLRFYTWSVPTVSLGYFQPAAVRERDANLVGLPWVRRATGGSTIVHHHELTYALALTEGKPWQPVGESWICKFHDIVRSVLLDHGIAARGVTCGEETKLGEVLCFLHQTPADLTLNSSKIVGSAQRKRRGSLLQHGSLLLKRSPFAPALPGINDAADHELFMPDSLAKLLAARFAAECDCQVLRGDWLVEERQARVRIRETKYANAEWNGKR